MSGGPHPGDPLDLFRAAFTAALAREPFDASAMSLATVDEEGRPSSRIVLLKGADDRGFCFFTNYESRKGRQLAARPVAALAILWPKGEEQVRVEGDVERLSAEESDAYFRTRPRAAQIGAWASAQSSEIPSREALEARVAEVAARYEGLDVPRPPHWGGLRVVPSLVEFWYGRPSRLHERHVYRREPGGGFRHALLSP